MTLYYSLHETHRLFGTEVLRTRINEAIDIYPNDQRVDITGWINKYLEVKLRDYKQEEKRAKVELENVTI